MGKAIKKICKYWIPVCLYKSNGRKKKYSVVLIDAFMCLYLHVVHFFHIMVSLCSSLSMDVCIADKQSQSMLPPSGSFLSYFNMPQRSSPKDHNHCQTLPALSVLAPSHAATLQALDPPLHGPHWSAKVKCT